MQKTPRGTSRDATGQLRRTTEEVECPIGFEPTRAAWEADALSRQVQSSGALWRMRVWPCQLPGQAGRSSLHLAALDKPRAGRTATPVPDENSTKTCPLARHTAPTGSAVPERLAAAAKQNARRRRLEVNRAVRCGVCA